MTGNKPYLSILGALAAALCLAAAAPASAMLGGTMAPATEDGTMPAPPSTGMPDLDEVQKLVMDGKFDVALPKLALLDQAHPDNADIKNMIGYSYRKLGQYDTALGYYLQALQINPNHAGALEYLGELYVETGDADRAAQMLARLDSLCQQTACPQRDMLEQAIKNKN
jgi:tetratricopeptide (TPR) repeat protein